MKQEEEELTRHIKAVFEDVDDGLSENGWAELRKKYPEAPSRKLPIWWLSGVAAAILLVAGLLLLIEKAPQQIEQTDPITKNNANPNPTTNTEQSPAPALPTPAPAQKPAAATSKALAETAPEQNRWLASQAPNQAATNPSTAPVLAAIASQKDTAGRFNAPAQVLAQANQVVAAQAPAVANAVQQPATPVKETAPAKKTTEEFLNQQSEILMASQKKNEEKGKEIKNSFDVFTGTFVNYYANNSAKVNAGFGVNANIKVAQNVVLSVGAGLSQNRIAYDNNSRFAQAMASDVSSSAMAYNVISTESSISDIKVNAQLLAIDIPITVKVYPGKKKNFYIATGINSNSYLLQRYTYDYTVQNSAGFVKSVPIQEQTEESKFKGFDFANSAIIAVGLSQSLGRNTIIFEPYFKPTIGSMGDKNLKINTAGINLRFNFNGNKK